MLKFLSFLKSNESGLEKLVGIIAMIYPLTAIPQVAKIWYYKETAGVSLLFMLASPLCLTAQTCCSSRWSHRSPVPA